MRSIARCLAVVGMLAITFLPFSAKAAIYYDPGLPQNVHLPVGGSVTLYPSANPSLISEGGSWLEQVQPLYPGNFVSIFFIDPAIQVDISFQAPGSAEASGSFSEVIAYSSYFSPFPTFTYNQPGYYQIDYSYSARGDFGIFGIVYDSPEMNTLIRFGYLGGPVYDVAGSGTISVTVGSVPEPSTWAMMIVGFAGIGFLVYRRKQATAY